MDSARHTCLKLPTESEAIFVKGTWFASRFDLYITNGLDAWTCNASEDEVTERASNWDQPVSEYIQMSERYLGFQQPGSVYGFADAAGPGYKRLSWTFERNGTRLEWRWKFQPAVDNKKITAEILNFLMDANIRLSEEVVLKTRSNEKLRVEAEKCLSQSERFSSERAEFEASIYAKFLVVLNSKKAKLRQLRDQLAKREDSLNVVQEEEESTDKTKTLDGSSDSEKGEEESTMNLTSTSKNIPSRHRVRKRK